MGIGRLPRTPEAQRTWARRLVTGLNVPPPGLFLLQGESLAQAYQRIFCWAYELGAEAALRQVLKELEVPDDPCAGLPPHLVKSARAAAKARQAKGRTGCQRRREREAA